MIRDKPEFIIGNAGGAVQKARRGREQESAGCDVSFREGKIVEIIALGWLEKRREHLYLV